MSLTSRLPSLRSLMDFGLVLGGTAFATGTGFIIKIGLGRTLGPEALGMFGLCYAALSWLSMVSDLGIRYSLVTLATQSWAERPEDARRMITASLLVKLAAGLVLWLLLWQLAPLAATHLLHKPALAPFLQITAVGIFFWTLWDGLEGAFHTRQHFREASALRILMDMLRLMAFFTLLLFHAGHYMTLDRYLWLYFLAPVSSLLIGAPLAFALLRPIGRGCGAVLKPLASFGRGIFVYRACTMLLLFLDSFMLGRYGALDQVGRYEAAKGLAYALLLVSETLGAVLLPKVNLIKEREQLRAFLRRFGNYLLVLAAAGAVWLWMAGGFLRLFGPQFHEPNVVDTFRILVVSTLVMVPATLMGTVLISLKRPATLAGISLAQVVLGLLLYPYTTAFGIQSTAWTSVGLQMLGALLMLTVLRSHLKD